MTNTPPRPGTSRNNLSNEPLKCFCTGSVEVQSAAELNIEDRHALETLAAQVALALETVARAREKAEAERERVRDMFARFVPEAVVEELLSQADGVPRLLGCSPRHNTLARVPENRDPYACYPVV